MSNAQSSPKGVLLEDLTWIEAEQGLTPNTVIVIPLGAAAKEHGPHLPLKNDLILAEYLKQRVLEISSVVVAPTIPYSFYPAFLEYPGSVSLRLETARDSLIDICRSLSRYGPRRFYVLNSVFPGSKLDYPRERPRHFYSIIHTRSDSGSSSSVLA